MHVEVVSKQHDEETLWWGQLVIYPLIGLAMIFSFCWRVSIGIHTGGQPKSSLTTCLWDFTFLSLPFPPRSHNQPFGLPYPSTIYSRQLVVTTIFQCIPVGCFASSYLVCCPKRADWASEKKRDHWRIAKRHKSCTGSGWRRNFALEIRLYMLDQARGCADDRCVLHKNASQSLQAQMIEYREDLDLPKHLPVLTQ